MQFIIHTSLLEFRRSRIQYHIDEPMQFRALSAVLVMTALSASGAPAPALDRQFQQTVRPFVAKYCTGCHSGPTPAAQFDLKAYATMDTVTRDYPRWALVLE